MANDVFKILKDLEAKIVGLDPAKDKVQDGYFVSFRTVGLPVHQDDFENPLDPFGGDMEAAFDKAIAKVDAKDPKDAPKTGSNQIDINKLVAAGVGKAEMNFLNTFALTDDKLKMNSQYEVMPQSSKVSDSWWAIITGANGIPMDSELSDEMKAAYEKVKAVLVDKDNKATPQYTAYMKYQEKYNDKVKAWQRAYANAFTDPMRLQNWPNEGKLYHEDANEAMQQWIGLGFKEDIDKALATLAAQGIDPAIALIDRAKSNFQNCLLEFPSIPQIPYTFLLPNSWYDRDNDDGWYEYSKNDFHSESHYKESSTSFGAGGGFSLGFWSASASFDDTTSQSSMNMKTSDLEITFKYCAVDIKRPWLDTSLLNLSNWFLMGDYKKGCISDGTMGQELPERSDKEPTFLPSVVTSLILIKDRTIWWQDWQSDWDQHTQSLSVGTSVGFGPFAVSGHYSHQDGEQNFDCDRDGESLRVPGIQLLGYVSVINPVSPGKDSSEFLKKKDK